MHRVQHRWSQCAPFRNLLLLLAIAPVAHAGMDATAATMQAATDCSMEATRPGPARLGAPGEVDGDRAAYAADEEPSDPCLITVSEAWTRSQAGDAVIVDVRPPLDFERYRIARSFNIPLYAIKVKPFLRHQGLILVNEGRTPRELVRACHALRTLGFDQVAVMHGGLRAWWQAQQPIVGDHAALAELHRLQPQELYWMRHERDWLLLGTAADLSAARELLPGLDAVAISTQGERPFDVDPLDGRLLTADELLVVTAHGEGHAQIEAALRQRGRTDALFLEGGLVAYQTYVEHQQRLARPMSGNEAYGAQCAAARDGS